MNKPGEKCSHNKKKEGKNDRTTEKHPGKKITYRRAIGTKNKTRFGKMTPQKSGFTGVTPVYRVFV